MLKNIGRLPANAANTRLVWRGSRLLALWEGGQQNPVTRGTPGKLDFNGSLARFDPFSAHGKHDPATGCCFHHGMGVGKRGPRVNQYRINPVAELDTRGHFLLPFSGQRLHP